MQRLQVKILNSRIGDDIPFIILSDHGFTTIKKEIYLEPDEIKEMLLK